MEDYEVFHYECKMLQIGEIKEGDQDTSNRFPPEYEEYKERGARVDDMPTHHFERDKIIKYELSVKKVNLGDKDNPKIILVDDD